MVFYDLVSWNQSILMSPSRPSMAPSNCSRILDGHSGQWMFMDAPLKSFQQYLRWCVYTYTYIHIHIYIHVYSIHTYIYIQRYVLSFVYNRMFIPIIYQLSTSQNWIITSPTVQEPLGPSAQIAPHPWRQPCTGPFRASHVAARRLMG